MATIPRGSRRRQNGGRTITSNKTLRILGTHGVPAAYGGFETAAENVARHLVKHGWRVVVYCQVPGSGPITEDVWQGIERVLVPISTEGWLATSRFDLLSIRHASQRRDLCLTFGYNTAVLNTWQRLVGIPNVINMDGIEWSRARWGPARQAILYVNERIGCLVGNHLIADHPEIETYLRGHAPARKITTITYGADVLPDAPTAPVRQLGLEPAQYLTIVARLIPENSILELVRGFSARPRGRRLVVVGACTPESDPYHRAVVDAGSDEVGFLGPVYDSHVLGPLRAHSLAYLHGHTVGGTNPSLVEALAAGNPVVAHDNAYNRWVAQDGALYVKDAAGVDGAVTRLIAEPDLAARLGAAASRRHQEEFTWEHVAGQYEALLERFLPRARSRRTGSAAQPAAQTGDRT